MHYYLAFVVLESYYPHGYLWVHFTMESPTFSLVLQKTATTELLRDASSPLISIASVSPIEHQCSSRFSSLK